VLLPQNASLTAGKALEHMRTEIRAACRIPQGAWNTGTIGGQQE
jgi:hypothetical protein